MQRSILGLLAFSSFVLVACEDGPNQTFSPAAPGSGDVWNNGNSDAAVGTGTQGFALDGGGGNNKQLICTNWRPPWSRSLGQDVQRAHHAAAFRRGAGLGGRRDVAGPDDRPAAEKISRPTSLGPPMVTSSATATWTTIGATTPRCSSDYRIFDAPILGMTYSPGYLGGVGYNGNEPNDQGQTCQPMKS